VQGFTRDPNSRTFFFHSIWIVHMAARAVAYSSRAVQIPLRLEAASSSAAEPTMRIAFVAASEETQ
jgi:hypothetical protein